jgi:integrase/recombinase XerD
MPKQQPSTIELAYSVYRLDAQARRVTPGTLRTYSDRIEPFIRWCNEQGVTLLAEITSTLLRTYFVHLQERNLSSYTVNGIGRALKAFLNFCVKEGLIPESPMRRVTVPKVDKKILPAFSVEDVQKLLGACEGERDEAIILFLLDTGVRAGEFVGLNGGDIDQHTGSILVRQGKGRKDRTVHIGARARKQLLRYYALERGTPGPAEPVWVSERGGKRLTASGLRQLLERIGQVGGVSNCSPHTFRRTCALWMLRSGASIYHVQRFLGHEDLTVLRQYLALVEGDIKAAHQQHGAVDNML